MAPARRGEPIEARSWAHQLTQQVGREVERHRRRQGLKILDLVERCAALGHPMPRMTIANLESGKRESVSLAEILVLAEALEVFPVALMFPLQSPGPIAVSPNREMYAGQAVMWLAGNVLEDDAGRLAQRDPVYRVLYWLRSYEAAVHKAMLSLNRTQDPSGYEAWDDETQQFVRRERSEADTQRYREDAKRLLEESMRSLDYARRILVGLGLTPRPLPPELDALEVLSPIEQWMVDGVTVTSL